MKTVLYLHSLLGRGKKEEQKKPERGWKKAKKNKLN